MTLQEIYNTLLASKRIQLNFNTTQELKLFKIKLHQLKLANEKPAVEIGILEEQEIQQLNFSVDDTELMLKVTLFFSKREPKKQYAVKILEE